jgi:uncharacterized membrane protein
VSGPPSVDTPEGRRYDVPLSWRDETVARASFFLGGIWGARAVGGDRRWTPMRVVLGLSCLTLVLAYVQKSPCADGAWVGNKQYTHACYSDVVPLWGDERLDVGDVPYRDNGVEYPVLVGGFMWLTTGLTRAVQHVLSGPSDIQVFGGLTCLLLALCALFAVAGTVGAAGRRPYDAALFALSPLLVFHAFSNWDLLAMAFASCALWAWAREKPVAAGVLIGLGTAAKLYPVFLLVPIMILAWRTGRWREALWCAASAVLAWAAVNIPIAWGYYSGWREFYAFSAARGTEASTFWYMGHYLIQVGWGGGYPTDWVPPSFLVALACAAALGLVTWLGLSAPVRPRLAQLAFLSVFAFLVTTKVWSPQYSLWLVPLAALARPRWRLNILWQFSEIAVWIATLFLLLGYTDTSHGIDYGWLMFFLLVRDGFLFAISGLIIFEMWHPEQDIVRTSGLDDPGGGVFEGLPDDPRFAFARNAAAEDPADDADDPVDTGDAYDTGDVRR